MTLKELKAYNLQVKHCKMPWQKKAQSNWFITLTATNGNSYDVPIFHSKYMVSGHWSPIYISDNMSGKMQDMPSCSTSCLKNKTCIERMKNKDLVCSACFSVDTQQNYLQLRKHMEYQTWLMSNIEIPSELMPVLNSDKIVLGFRNESFGDTCNVIHAVNFIRFAIANPNVMFTMWTKNHMWMCKALEITGKPENMILVASSYRVNVPDLKVLEKYPFYDYLFTVWDTIEGCIAAGYQINCGFNKCVQCKHCYTKHNGKLVNELLKDAQDNYTDNYGTRK